MANHSQLDYLQEQFDVKYGTGWERYQLSDEDHKQWVNESYVYYEEECELSPTYISKYADDAIYGGLPFQIVEPVDPDEDGFDLETLPIWRVWVGEPDENRYYSENTCDSVYAYPENLFVNP